VKQILVRNLDERTVAALKERARQHRRSLSQEAKLILETASEVPAHTAGEVAARIREHLRRRGERFGDSAAAQRRDRAR
jgi:plasmid stability protein